MSQHWYAIHSMSLGLSVDDRARLLFALAKSNPKLASTLSNLNWDSLTALAVENAFRKTAELLGLTVKKKFYNRGRKERLDGELVAVMTDGEVQLGLRKNPDGTFSTFENGYDRERHGSTINRWRQKLETTYRTSVMKIALGIIGCEVKETEDEQGNKVLIGVKGKVTS